ncbi:MAG: hypothetical protein ACQGVK_02225 [Myxococcota bacterium]
MTIRPVHRENRPLMGRTTLALFLALVLAATACEEKAKTDDTAELARVGLQARPKTLVEYADGTLAFVGSDTEVARRGVEPVAVETGMLSLSLPAVEPWSASADEVVVFANEAEGLALRAQHGIEPPAPGAGGVILDFVPGGDDDWLEPPATADDFTILARGAEDDSFRVATMDLTSISTHTLDLADSDELVSGGGGGGGGVGGVGGLTGGGPALPVRYAMSDGLELRTLPDFGGSLAMELLQGDRVFVLDTLPVPGSGGHVFVEVQVADRSPYPTGWFPLHWLLKVDPQSSADTLDPKATYGLFGRLARDFIQERFWKGCNTYPVFPHDATFFQTPTVVDVSIPEATRYDCGELPLGAIENDTTKYISTYEFSTPSYHYDVAGIDLLHIDSIPLEIPIELYRLPWQTRGDDYAMLDLSSGWYQQFDDSNADVVEHSRYARTPGVLEEDAVRVHDTDFWYNLGFEPPAGVEDIGAEAYLNVCMALPGTRIRGGLSPMDVSIHSVAATSHVEGVSWGAFDLSPFRLCATAAVSTEPGDPAGDFTTGPQSPLRLRLLRASLHGLSIEMVEGLQLYGHFAGVHGVALLALTEFLNGVLQETGVLGLVFDAYFEEGLEARLLSWLNDMAATLAQGLPDPDAELADACDLMPAAYASPTHRYYPIYRHCQDAVQAASVQLATNSDEAASACHADPNAYGRANDVTSFTSPEDDEDLYYVDQGGASPQATVVERPWWNACGLESEIDTVVPDDYWPVLECAAVTLEDALNYQMSSGSAQNRLRSECLIPTVKLLCDWYGEGDDLIELWSAGGAPATGNTFGFCDWYADLTAPDTPDYTIGGS